MSNGSVAIPGRRSILTSGKCDADSPNRTLERAGTLPWTIEGVSDQLESAWRRGDCDAVLRLSGYLAHYVGDASQPLHSTIHYDGYAGDRGIHARIELAVDHSLRELEPMAAREIHVEEINDVWTPVDRRDSRRERTRRRSDPR